MKKVLLITLILIAVPLYGYNMFLLLRGSLSSKGDKAVAAAGETVTSFETVLYAATPVSFVEKGKDPFTLYKEPPRPIVPVKKEPVKEKPVKKEVNAPAIVVTGIMWNPDNPVATVKMPGGKSSLVKSGQQLGENLSVKKIEKRSVTVVFEGKEFTINKK